MNARRTRVPSLSAWALLLSLGAGMACAAQSSLSISGGIPIYVNLSDPSLNSYQTAAITHTAYDLQRDMSKVFGQASPIAFQSPPAGAAGPLLYIATRRAALSDARVSGALPQLSGTESHQVVAVSTGSFQAIVMEGADARGTLYATYTFSEKVLGIPPFWFWASWVPAHRSSIGLAPGVLYSFGPPTVPWRAWMFNDQDFIAAWESVEGSLTPAPAPSTGAANTLDPLYETMLRLKLNALSTGSDLTDFSYDATTGQASHSGLGTATAVLNRGFAFVDSALGNIANWQAYWAYRSQFTNIPSASPVRNPNPTSYSPALTQDLIDQTLANPVPAPGAGADQFQPTDLETFWLYHIQVAQVLLPQAEIIWCLTFRGAGDSAYYGPPGGPAYFAGAPTDPPTGLPAASLQLARAQLFQAMYAHQAALLSYALGNPCPFSRAEYYAETEDLLDAGMLSPISDGCTMAQFSNERREHFITAGALSNLGGTQALGFYQNFDYSTSGSHYVDAEGPWKVEQNYQPLIATNRLVYSIVNIGNVREYALSASANAAMLWSPSTYSTDAFLADWTAEYFGPAQAAQIAQLYTAFYAAYWQQQASVSALGVGRQYLFQDLRWGLAAHYFDTSYAKSFPATPGLTVESPFRSDNEYYDWHSIVPQYTSNDTDQIPALIDGGQAMLGRLSPLQASCASILGQLAPNSSSRVFLQDDVCFAVNYLAGVISLALSTANVYQTHRTASNAPGPSEVEAAFRQIEELLFVQAHAPAFPGTADFRGFYSAPQKFDPYAACLEFQTYTGFDIDCRFRPADVMYDPRPCREGGSGAADAAACLTPGRLRTGLH
jgi:hypothetical protein